MRVRMLQDWRHWRNGQVYDVDYGTGEALLANGVAEPEMPQRVETAAMEADGRGGRKQRKHKGRNAWASRTV